MAESGVNPEQDDLTAPSPAKGWMDFCVLLAPSAEYERWLERIQVAAFHAGTPLLIHHDPDLDRETIDPRSIILTTNKRFLDPSPGAQVVAIVTNVGSAIPKTRELTGGDGLYAVIDATKMLMDAHVYPGARVLTESSFRDAGGSLELFPGVVVEAPDYDRYVPVKPLDRAAAESIALFAEGLPAVGVEMVFPPIMFFYEDRRAELREAPNRLDLTGGPRVLLNGPHLALPPGEWEVTVKFTVDHDGARHRFSIEWGSLDDFATFDFLPMEGAEYSATLRHKWTEEAPVELRILLRDGCITGGFEFLGAVVRRLQ